MSLLKKAIALLLTSLCAILLYGPDTHQQFVFKMRDYAGWFPMRIIVFAIGLLSLLWLVGMVVPDFVKRQFRRNTPFEKLSRQHGKWSFEAQWGVGDKWLDSTLLGTPLKERVVYLLCMGEQSKPLPAKHINLQVPEIGGPVNKELRLIYPDKWYLVFSELDGILALDPNIKVFPPDHMERQIVPISDFVPNQNQKSMASTSDPDPIVRIAYPKAGDVILTDKVEVRGTASFHPKGNWILWTRIGTAYWPQEVIIFSAIGKDWTANVRISSTDKTTILVTEISSDVSHLINFYNQVGKAINWKGIPLPQRPDGMKVRDEVTVKKVGPIVGDSPVIESSRTNFSSESKASLISIDGVTLDDQRGTNLKWPLKLRAVIRNHSSDPIMLGRLDWIAKSKEAQVQVNPPNGFCFYYQIGGGSEIQDLSMPGKSIATVWISLNPDQDKTELDLMLKEKRLGTLVIPISAGEGEMNFYFPL